MGEVWGVNMKGRKLGVEIELKGKVKGLEGKCLKFRGLERKGRVWGQKCGKHKV